MSRRIGLLSALILASLPLEATAGIRPSFDLDSSAAKATHVVVATEGEGIDGVLEVLESWKGDLGKGAVILVPELAQFASEKSRRIGWGIKHGTVTDSRMVLFLVKSLEPATSARKLKKDTRAAPKTQWLPASFPDYQPVFAGGPTRRSNFERMRISVAWIENGMVYAFQQIMNPGPVTLVRLGRLSEADVRARVLKVGKDSKGLQEAAAIPDPVKRAAALVQFTEVKEHRERERAFNALAECGAPALPYLRRILKDDTLADRHYLAVNALAKAGGVHVGPELTTLLEQELAFWKRQAPLVKATKWNDLPARLRSRHVKLEQALAAVTMISFPGARKAMSAIQSFWQSHHQVNRLTGGPRFSSIAFRCKAYLDLELPRPALMNPRDRGQTLNN